MFCTYLINLILQIIKNFSFDNRLRNDKLKTVCSGTIDTPCELAGLGQISIKAMHS